MLKLQRQFAADLRPAAFRAAATLRDVLDITHGRRTANSGPQILMTCALRIGYTAILISGASLATMIAVWLLVAAGIWGLVTVMTWREISEITFG